MKSRQKKMSKKQNTKKYNSRRNIKKFKQHGGWPVNCVEIIHGIPQVTFTIDVTPDDKLYDVYKKIHRNIITRHPHISLYQMYVRLNDEVISWRDLKERHRTPDPPGVVVLRLRENVYHTTKMSELNFQPTDWFTVRLIPNTTVEQVVFKTLTGQSYPVTFNRYDPIYIIKEKLLQQNPALVATVSSFSATAPTYAHIHFANSGNDLGNNLEPISEYYIDNKDTKFSVIIRNPPVVDADVTHAYQMAAALPAAPVAPPPALPPAAPAPPPVAGGRYKWNY